jgi:hypothetical protein
MVLKKALLNVVGVAWTALAFGSWFAVDLGYAPESVTFAEVPGGETGAFAIALGATIAGWAVVGVVRGRLERAEWQSLGQQLGFTPAKDGAADATALTGPVDGRPVTLRYEDRKQSSSGEGGTRTVRYTFADVALDEAAADGVVVGAANGEVSADRGSIDFEQLGETVDDVSGLHRRQTEGLLLVGTSPRATEAVATGRAGDALQAVSDLQIASVGDGAAVVERWAEAQNADVEESGGSVFEFPVENLVDRVPGHPDTATVETKTDIRDADVLERFAAGTVAVGDAFEAAVADPPADDA